MALKPKKARRESENSDVLKSIRKKYKKAVDTAKRSGGGRTVACFFDI